MIQVIRKNEYEFVCIFDRAGLKESVGTSLSRVRKSEKDAQRLAAYAIDAVMRKYELAANPTEFKVIICEDRSKSEANIMVLVKYVTSEMEIEEDLEDDVPEEMADYVEYEDEEGEESFRETAPVHTAFAFSDIEHIIRMQGNTRVFDMCPARLFHFKGKYFVVPEDAGNPDAQGDLFSILSEYGTAVPDLTVHFLEEYGKFITDDIPKMVDILEGRGA